MKLVVTLVVRDEIDVIDTHLSYYLNAGVDFVIATDHDSRDGTTKVLEFYARAGRLRLIHEEGPFRESKWRTTMARLAATEHGADWVVNTDADEFWMPWGGSLKGVLESVPANYGVVWALTRHFVPRPDDETHFSERMVARVAQKAAINDPTSPYRPHAKVAHRGVADVVVHHGAHLAHSPSLEPLRDWYPADVLHFPFRSRQQYGRKGVRGVRDSKPLGQYVKASLANTAGRIASVFDALVVDDVAFERGLHSGALALDTRLRDAMRRIDSQEALRRPTSMHAPGGSISERVDAIAEGSALRDADLVRVRRRLDEMAVRVAMLEGRAVSRPGRTGAA